MKRLFPLVTILLLTVLSAPITARATGTPSVSLSVAPESEHPCVGYSSVTLVATIAGAPATLHLLHRPAGGAWTRAGTFGYHTHSGTYTISVSEPSAASYEYAAVPAPVTTSNVQPQLTLPWKAPGLSLTEDTASSEVGTDLGLSVALSCVKAGHVAFKVSGPGAATAPASVPATAPDVTTSYTSDTEGTDTVTASYRICSDLSTGSCSTFRSGAIHHVWTLPTASLALTGPSTSCVGESATVSAVLQQDGTPVSGVVVTFDVSGSDGSTLSFTATSDASGTATMSYSRSSSTLDSVTATAAIPGTSPNPVTADTTLQWSSCALTAALSPADPHAVIGSPMTETVSVLFNGAPAQGAQVQLTEAMAGQPTLTMTGTSDSNGSVAFVLSRDVVGDDRLAVTARYANSVAASTTTVVWAAAGSSSTAVPSPQPTSSSSVPPVAPPVAPRPPPNAAVARLVPTEPMPAQVGSSPSPAPTPSRAAPSTASIPTTSPERPRPSPVRPWPPGSLTVRDASPLPGEADAVTGRGCRPHAIVVVAVDGVALARTRADAHGAFHAGFVAPVRPVGRHRLTATCERVLATPLDYVSSASTGGANGVLVGTILVGLAVLAFVVVPVLRRGFGIGRV